VAAVCSQVVINLHQRSVTYDAQSKTEEFFDLVSATVESYACMLASDAGLVSKDAEETQFVLALCGIVTSKGCNFHFLGYLINALGKENSSGNML
jgi:hypothetical protein